jgi:putative two-component system response regulator
VTRALVTEGNGCGVAEDKDKPRILATDDRPEVLRIVDRALGERYELAFAGNASEARERIDANRFDLALCDIQMPGGSGLDLAEEIAREHPETGVVLVTGVDDPEVADRALAFGACGYLVKPFWPGQLLITTMNALRRHELELAHEAHERTLEDRIQMLMDAAPVPIYIKDRERRYTIANKVAHEVAGLKPNELIGMTDREIMSPESERIAAETDARILEHGETYTEEEAIGVGGEEKRHFLTVKFPYLDDDGQIAGITGISTDITDKKRAEELREYLAATQQRAIDELQASRQETIERLTRAIEMHDAATGRHVSRMASTAAFLAEKLGLERDRVLLLRTAAPMHDVGKVATPDGILRKEGPLTPEERGVMEQHTTVGHQILSGSDSELLQLAAEVALTHHERWDGSGYPRGLEGEEIPIAGRIVAVADVFDAVLSDRPYRPALPVKDAINVIRDGSGGHFDPRVAAALLDHAKEVLSLRD